jgi:hypothetical protein
MIQTVRKFPDKISMSVPTWISSYQPVDDIDARLFNHFHELYKHLPGSKEEKRASSQIYNILVTKKLINEGLIYKKMQSKGKGFKFSQDHYDDAVSQGCIWLSEKIRNFDLSASKTTSLTKGLTNWISIYIAWRLLDLHLDDLDTIDSLDIPQFNDDELSEETRLDNIPAGLQDLYNAPNLDELLNGNLLNELSASDYKQVLLDIKEYLENDPYKLLRSRHIPGYPECTYKILTERLILQDQLDTIRSIAHDFHIPESNLYAHLIRTFYPIIASIYIELGSYPEGFQEAILKDADGSLRKCNKILKGRIVYDVQILAQKLLPLFQPPNFIFTTVVNYLNQKGYEEKTSLIPIYHEKYFAIYSKIAEELKIQGLEKITSFDVLTYWETATIETLITELKNQGYEKINYQQIKQFWDEKCRKVLGKLAISLNKGDK